MAIPLLERPAPSRDSAVCSAPRPIPGSRLAERKRARLAVLSGPDWPWARLGLLGVLVLSAALEFWHLNQLTYANSYYAAAVLSMTQSLHAFLFNSFDSAGFVTIDKPPLGFWIQVLSAKLLGFSNFSILLPEALATLASVALVYQLVKRAFGVQAGLLAALILAVVPVSVIVGRSNIIDALLVFSLLIAAWTCLRATQRGSLRWLLLTGAIIGLGFEIKMMEAYLVVPALGLVYLVGAPLSMRKRVGHLAMASVVMLMVSLAWVVGVDLTPANLRPFVDSTTNNSAVSLAIGYNGIDRLIGMNQSVSQFLARLGLNFAASDASASSSPGGPMFDNGPAGVLRLFDQQLAGQASWLLPLSLVGLGMALWRAIKGRLGFARSGRGQASMLFGTWLLTEAAFFSVASFFHSYYLVTLGPPIAAMAAIGAVELWSEFRARTRLGWLFPIALIGTAAVQARILGYYPTWSGWLTPIIVAAAAAGAGVLVYARARRRLRLGRAAAAVAIGALLIAPQVWSGYSTTSTSLGMSPSAGPALTSSSGLGARGGASIAADGSGAQAQGSGGRDGSASSALISYLEDNQGSATYLVATADSQTAAPIILASGKPVMSLGGFSGSDPILTLDQFASLVQSGQVRYVLVNGNAAGDGRGGGSSAIMSWVSANGAPVAGMSQLYDLGALQGAAG